MKYLAALIAIALIYAGMILDLSGERQREVKRLSEELTELLRQIEREKTLFDLRDRSRRELAKVMAESHWLQQIAAGKQVQK